jgi:hypothetical protein
MLVTAILVAELDVSSCFLTTMVLGRLLYIANDEVDASSLLGEPSKWDLPQVHAKNTMRSIFTESRLAHVSFLFLEPAFGLAIRGFRSNM